MFTKFIIETKPNIFEELNKNIEFEDIINGRKGAVIADCKNNLIPIVRTTSTYNKPVQQFLPIHYDIIENIKKISKCNNLELNNALIEIYDSSYSTMKYHSDMSLDLALDSYICIFSYYNNDNNILDIRKLKIKNKITEECSEILLEHNSVVMFNQNTNNKYLHKIVLEQNTIAPFSRCDNLWQGITFRLSKTFIKFIDETPYFISPDFFQLVALTLANTKEKQEFYRCKGLENLKSDYCYPEINYTISASDMLNITQVV